MSFIIFWDFLMFYQIFLSPQVKRWAIVTYKHGIYELPNELRNNLTFVTLVLKFILYYPEIWGYLPYMGSF